MKLHLAATMVVIGFAMTAGSPILCPDKQGTCPEGSTCCKLATGKYGCCPLPKAVCCSDHTHCCPQGTTCDVAGGRCQYPSGVAVAWSSKSLVQPAPVESVICPGGKSMCEDGQTCCLQKGGEFACCPLPSAVCCSDGIHCCPAGTTCDLKAGKCNHGNYITQLVSKVDAKPTAPSVEKETMCPDGISSCPEETTCCKMLNNHYSCCPMKEAVCCKDQLHCCAKGQTCNDKTGECQDPAPLSFLPWSVKTPATKNSANKPDSNNIICPDGTSQCPDGNTCCKLSSGGYGCCPYPQAVCCSDEVSCCPSGYTCDIKSRTCSRQTENGLETIPRAHKTPAVELVTNVVCPDGTSQCPDRSTCCKLSTGAYGCCPLPSAVCCADGEHCCPNGYTCDAGRCSRQTDSGLETVPMVAKTPAVVSVKDVICPDGTSECPAGNTCCKLNTGDYGCCPLPRAVCCADGEHCCPNGYTCDAGSCSRQTDSGLETVPMVVKTPAVVSVKDVFCPDGTSRCPAGNTCCKLNTGDYGCCPLPRAVCCADGEHCCPNGYTCDAGSCSRQTDSGLETVPMVVKTPAVVSVKDVFCPDGTSRCPAGNTCCKLNTGVYGCCPLPNAVCCADGEHCCPNGYTCDAGRCSRQTDSGLETVPMVAKTPAVVSVKDVICPDGTSECPDGTTCCKSKSGQYGCCPFPSAVCCADGVHCCPNGYTCDVSAGSCSRQIESGLEKVPIVRKNPALASETNLVCLDRLSQCPEGTTCCKLNTGASGCCPYPNAVCCSDGIHCCPHGNTCEPSTGTCSKQTDSGLETVLMALKTPALALKSNIVCPDQKSQCPDGTTCCMLSTGTYGCCPYPQAVCCSDHEHCCPSGTTCDVAGGKCQGASNSMPWGTKFPALKQSPDDKDAMQCGNSTKTCPESTTCCQLPSGAWGCCPFNTAECCKDGLHCCPKGTKCNEHSDCSSLTSSLTVSSTLIARPSAMLDLIGHQRAQIVRCEDGSQCPDGTTCCKIAKGKYGCCAYPKATCCDDKQHCCPEGYTCGRDNCIKEGSSFSVPLSLFTRNKAIVPAMQSSTTNMCQDKKVSCPDDYTCCPLSTGNYGCCPLPNAMCCADGEHCCPQGSTCDLQTGHCSTTASWTDMLQKPASPSQSDQVLRFHPRGQVVKKSMQTQVVCPDKTSECPTGNTCCRLLSGAWGCCPLVNATCCADRTHCCPSGYRCDVQSSTCYKQDASATLLTAITTPKN